MDEEWAMWSNERIAQQCGVDPRMVASYRESHSGSSGVTERKTVNKHGQETTIKVGNIGKSRKAPPASPTSEATTASVPDAVTPIDCVPHHPSRRAADERFPDPDIIAGDVIDSAELRLGRALNDKENLAVFDLARSGILEPPTVSTHAVQGLYWEDVAEEQRKMIRAMHDRWPGSRRDLFVSMPDELVEELAAEGAGRGVIAARRPKLSIQ